MYKYFAEVFLRKIIDSHIAPSKLGDMGDIANIESDLKQWYVAFPDDEIRDKNNAKGNKDDGQLELLEKVSDPEAFFEGLKRYAYDFE